MRMPGIFRIFLPARGRGSGLNRLRCNLPEEETACPGNDLVGGRLPVRFP